MKLALLSGLLAFTPAYASAATSPACQAAHAKYAALYQQEWHVEEYKAFLARFNAASRRVRVTITAAPSSGLAEAMPLEQWCETYKYRERYGAEGWEGLYSMFKAQRDTYLNGRVNAASIEERLKSVPAEERARELARRIDVSRYFPGEMGKERMTTGQFLDIYLGPVSIATAGAQPPAPAPAAVPEAEHTHVERQPEISQRGEAAIVAAGSRAASETFFLRDAPAPLAPAPLLPSRPALSVQALAITPPSVSQNVLTAPVAAPRPVVPTAPRPRPATVAPPLMVSHTKATEVADFTAPAQQSVLGKGRFTMASSHNENGDAVYVVKDAAGSPRATFRRDAVGNTLRWIKWGQGATSLFYYGYTSIPNHGDRDLRSRDKIELLTGGIVRLTSGPADKPVLECVNVLNGRGAPCPVQPAGAANSIVGVRWLWGTELKTLAGELFEVQWKPASNHGGSYLRLKSGAKSIEAPADKPRHYVLKAGTVFELKRIGERPVVYEATEALEFAKSSPPSGESLRLLAKRQGPVEPPPMIVVDPTNLPYGD